MTADDCYRLLGLEPGASNEEIKKAYRKKAREFHPDINSSPSAVDQFVDISKAYHFLMSNGEHGSFDQEEYDKAMAYWRKYRKDISERKSSAKTAAKYGRLKKSDLNRMTRVFDAASLAISFIVSVLVMFFTIDGYIDKIHNPVPGTERQSLISLVLLITLSLIFFAIFFIYLSAFRKHFRKGRSGIK